MSANNYDPRSFADRMGTLFGDQNEAESRATLARIEKKLDALTAALVKPQSSIILVGDDIARIAAEIARGAK